MTKLFLFLLIAFSNIALSKDGGISQIKEILIKDKLIQKADANKLAELKKAIDDQEKIKIANKPVSEEEFWDILTSLWLVKRESKLKWDFKKVDYGVNTVFESLLSELNISGEKYKILYLNSETVPHIGINSGYDYILLISKPFVEKLDLSKQEISLILLEEYLRLKLNLLKNRLSSKLNNLKMDTEPRKAAVLFEKYMSILDEEIFNKGFSFQDQFKLTKETVSHLKSNDKISRLYILLNEKIKRLIEKKPQYRNYTKLYPSPDMKERWLEKLLPPLKI